MGTMRYVVEGTCPNTFFLGEQTFYGDKRKDIKQGHVPRKILSGKNINWDKRDSPSGNMSQQNSSSENKQMGTREKIYWGHDLTQILSNFVKSDKSTL